ncbi:MAG: DUF2961 domain-containing protein [Polyangiaceae bacterium]
MRRFILAAALLGSCDDCRSGGSQSTPKSALPAEVADAEALAPLTDWLALPSFADGRYVQQSSEDRHAAGPVEQPLWANGNRDFNNFLCRGDRANAPDGKFAFVFDRDRCPEPDLAGLVMARFEGSGRLARLWLTSLSLRERPPDDETLRVYVDDDTSPRIEAPLSEVLSGGEEIFAPPFGAGSPHYVAWYYPVVFSKRLVLALDGTGYDDLYFCQVDAVLDPAPRTRTAAPTRLAARDQARDLTTPKGTPRTTSFSLAPSTSQTIDLSGAATIVSAKLSGDAPDVHLTVTWDGVTAIDLPLTAFLPRMGVDAPGPSLTLPMPFQQRATWTLENRGQTKVDFSLVLEVVDATPKAPWGKLHAARSERLGGAGASHPVIAVKGRGRLVGVCADLRGRTFQFLEGDETIVVDGERRVGGTGTEDYFNSAFYFTDGDRATRYAQVWDVEQTRSAARASACRWHVLGDAIDFTRSLEMSLETGFGSESIERYATVAYWYEQ